MVLMGFTTTTPRLPLPMSGPLATSSVQQDAGEVNELEYWEAMRCAWVDVMESAEACVLAVTNATSRHRAANRPLFIRHRVRSLDETAAHETAAPTICSLILHLEAWDITNSSRAQEAHGVSRWRGLFRATSGWGPSKTTPILTSRIHSKFKNENGISPSSPQTADVRARQCNHKILLLV
jgi:hypothetical protein